MQGRDYAVAIRTAHMMQKLGIVDVDVRMSDKVDISEALFCEISEALTRDDCTDMTKVALRKILDVSANYFLSDIEYKKRKGDNYTLYI